MPINYSSHIMSDIVSPPCDQQGNRLKTRSAIYLLKVRQLVSGGAGFQEQEVREVESPHCFALSAQNVGSWQSLWPAPHSHLESSHFLTVEIRNGTIIHLFTDGESGERERFEKKRNQK